MGDLSKKFTRYEVYFHVFNSKIKRSLVSSHMPDADGVGFRWILRSQLIKHVMKRLMWQLKQQPSQVVGLPNNSCVTRESVGVMPKLFF